MESTGVRPRLFRQHRCCSEEDEETEEPGHLAIGVTSAESSRPLVAEYSSTAASWAHVAGMFRSFPRSQGALPVAQNELVPANGGPGSANGRHERETSDSNRRCIPMPRLKFDVIETGRTA